MHTFEKEVPFDPGYSAISFSFLDNIEAVIQDYSKLKANHQKKFWLSTSEPQIIDLITKSSAFYLGCLLWGSFIHFRFKDEPKIITEGNIPKMSEEEFKEFDCAYEVKAILQYINILDRDCKYFLKRPAKISPQITDILNNYIEFAQLNNHFRNVKKTSDIKLPKYCDKFSKMTKEQLDSLCENIYSVISQAKIEQLLNIDTKL